MRCPLHRLQNFEKLNKSVALCFIGFLHFHSVFQPPEDFCVGGDGQTLRVGYDFNKEFNKDFCDREK